MGFAAAMSRGIDRLYGRVGEPARYTRTDTSVVDCTVIPSRDLERYGVVAEVNAPVVILSVRVSELPDRPRRGEKVELTDTGIAYHVSEVITSDRFEHRFLAA
jgi:hypothetical protein